MATAYLNCLLWKYFLLSCIIVCARTQTCNQYIWCDDCIAADHTCSWCQDQIFRGERCSTTEDLSNKGCLDIYRPNNSLERTQDDDIRDGAVDRDPIQLQPQRVKLQLRRGKPQSFNMKYFVAQNVPIDMYFVLDFSTTMRDRLQNLASLTEQLINGLKEKFTTNINIGFGSFLDKSIQPFHITTPAYSDILCGYHNGCILDEQIACKFLKNPCIVDNTVCEPTYGYRHRRKLGKDINGFIETIKNGNTSANYDPMEGGMDAVMQAAVCPQIIGWRSQSRRVMVYISDDGFHFAGDGKLAGIDTPCDGLCHLELIPSTGEYVYTKTTEQDYPSLGHVAKVLNENNINAFFVVSKKDEKIYGEFSKMMKQAETTTMDESGASKIVDEITDYYTKLSEKLSITAKDIPDEVKVSIATNCGSGPVNTIDPKTSSSECKYLTLGMTIDFNVTVELEKCPVNGVRNSSFTIFPRGLQELLNVEMEYICDCTCLKNETLDEFCSDGNGTYECGACRCNPGRSGELCQCDNSEHQSDSYFDDDMCKKDNTTDIICMNRGSCVCGQCQCNKDFEGKFCECDMSQCYGQIGLNSVYCSGHGDCQCGKCKCLEDHYGEHCECPPNTACIAPNGLECSGNGRCECGKCVCKSSDYKGEFCGECPRCEKCRKCGYAPCVDCLGKHGHRDNVTLLTECRVACKDLNMSHIMWLDRFKTGTVPCGRFDESNCEISYIVKCDENEAIDPYLQIAKTKQCPNPPDPLLIAMPLLAGIIGVGLLLLIIWKILTTFADTSQWKKCPNPPDPLLIAMPLLAGIIGVGLLLLIIWKILTTFYDKIEYARFEHEVSNPKWTKGENPIYNSPVTTNQNPTFTGKIDD